jgi:hypothetical protein
MRIGFIVECGPQGAEVQVIPHLARMLLAEVEPDVIPLDRKPRLKAECGRWAKELLARGCARVLILWDLLPDWGEYEGHGCRHEDKEEIVQSLCGAGLRPTDRRIRLVCIEKMLEAWVIADERALTAFLSTNAHPVRVRRTKQPESLSDPKAALIDLFRRSGSRFPRYVDRDHAIQIIRRLPDLARLRRSESFCRFEEKISQ